jgi:hypothetical protein
MLLANILIIFKCYKKNIQQLIFKTHLNLILKLERVIIKTKIMEQ